MPVQLFVDVYVTGFVIFVVLNHTVLFPLLHSYCASELQPLVKNPVVGARVLAVMLTPFWPFELVDLMFLYKG